jgi:hypothetical protein
MGTHRTTRRAFFLASALCATLLVGAAPGAGLEGVPRFAHIVVIVEENKDYDQIFDPASAPTIAGLAKTYGNATQFFGEVHPSEANYVALVGGSTFGIHDDDAYYCAPNSTRLMCTGTDQPGYANHTIDAPHIGTQLAAVGLTWKGYYESLPAPGSDAVVASDPAFADGTRKTALYASKHSGFMNFASVQNDPQRAQHIVGFDAFDHDVAANTLPSFALVVPNQCNEMHGLVGPTLPADCQSGNIAGLIRRGDATVAKLVGEITGTASWKSAENDAIVITFDEGSGKTRDGCCGVTPNAESNFGGGHIPTIVVTNHGPHGVVDPTPYNHYSLLRTIEDAFGIPQYLGLANATDKGVRPMTPLFK